MAEERVAQRPAGVASSEGLDSDRLDVMAGELAERRQEPFHEEREHAELAQFEVAVQDYYDTCDDAPRGDLQRLMYLDTGSAEVGWAWSACTGGAFNGTEGELLMFLVDESLHTPTFTDDLVVVQYMDGYFEVYRTYGFEDPNVWLLVDAGFGNISYSSSGEAVAGSFVVDAASAGFPFEYEFMVGTHAGGQLQDVLPKDGHPYPAFPTSCTRIEHLGAQVTVDPAVLDRVVGEIANLGFEVADVAERSGVIMLDAVSDDELRQLAALDRVDHAERPRSVEWRPPDGSLQLASATASSTWALTQLRLPEAWQQVPFNDVHVAVLDSGMDPRAAGLAGRVGAGFDAVTGQTLPPGAHTEMFPHGTGVSALIAADGAEGVSGANPGATVRPIRLASHDACLTTNRIVTAIDAATGMDEVTVINLSFGAPQLTAAEDAALGRASEAGKILVAAAGNGGLLFPDVPMYPASHPDVIAVGASTESATLALFTTNHNVEVLAPGEQVRSFGSSGSVELVDGTSFAAPYVSGALSLWLADNPNADLSLAREAIAQASSEPVDGGAGILDVAALLTTATTSPLFSDVEGTTHEDAIAALVAAQITSGFPDGTYRPAEAVTRGQMATFLTNALDLEAGSEPGFSDVEGTTHEDAIAALVAAQITSGFPDGTYRPAEAVTRGQMAAFLARSLNLL